jgi:hypothetical protein
MSLTVKQFCIYLRYVSKFESYNQLRAFEVSVYPYLNKDDREELKNKYMKPVNTPSIISSAKEVESSWQLLRERYADTRSRHHK